MDILLSACLIVRNEERFLDGCLASLKGVADEIVVVDTGSADDTKKIARRHGARLYDYRWKDDFSAARNYSVGLARGRWIFHIDADETIRPGSPRRLRSQLSAPGYIAYRVRLFPRPGFTPGWKTRLFRNDPRIRFEGIIHEDITRHLDVCRAAGGARVGFSDLIIDHEGYEGDQSAKNKRNFGLLMKAVRREPQRSLNWFHLGRVALALGKARTVDWAAKNGLDLVRADHWLRPEGVLAYIGFIERELRSGRDAEPIFAEALRRCPRDPSLQWLRAKTLMDAKRFREAVPHFERLIALGRAENSDHFLGYDKRLFDLFPYECLATCYFKLGDYAVSRRYFELVAGLAPDAREYRIKAAVCRGLEGLQRGPARFKRERQSTRKGERHESANP